MRMRNAFFTFLNSAALAGVFIVFATAGCTIAKQSPSIQLINGVPTPPGNEMLNIDESKIAQLRELRARDKFLELPGTDTYEERMRLTRVLDPLLDRLIAGISSNPNKAWVMEQFEISLMAVQMEDTEGREDFGEYLEQIMDVLNIESSDGLLNKYLVFLQLKDRACRV